MLRTFAERLARGRSLRRRLPATFGSRPLHVSPDSALSYFKPNWCGASTLLLSAATKYVSPSNCVWDIGANVGVFTFAAAHVGGPKSQVVALEADPFLASLIQKSAIEHANRDRNVNVLCAAATNTVGIGRFLIAERGRSSNSLEQAGHRSQAGGTRYAHYVSTVTLDVMLEHFPPPDVIKVDVEGAEVFVLAGSNRILAELRPLIYIEVGAEQNSAVTQVFRRHGYRLYNGNSSDGVELARCVFNTLAVPSESAWTNRPELP